MPGRTFLVTFDNSETSEYVFKWFLQNMARDDDTVVGAYVVEFKVPGKFPSLSSTNYDEIISDFKKQKDAVEKLEHKYNSLLKASPLKLHGECKAYNLEGRKIYERIIDTAKEVNASHIIMGRRNIGKVQRMFMGSNSLQVLQMATCPVTIVSEQTTQQAAN